MVGNPLDNPVMMREDGDGWGPESIWLRQPALGAYRIGVHYFGDAGFGASEARIRVFLDGELLATLEQGGLERSDYFWDVATLHMPSELVTPVDEVASSTPP